MEYKIQDSKKTETTEKGCLSDISVFSQLGSEELPVVKNFMVPKTKLLISKETNCLEIKLRN
jgi:hypothetical protein